MPGLPCSSMVSMVCGACLGLLDKSPVAINSEGVSAMHNTWLPTLIFCTCLFFLNHIIFSFLLDCNMAKFIVYFLV